MSSEGESELERAISPICLASGVRVFDVEFRSAVVSVTIEREGGLDLDLVAQVAREISTMIDARPDLGPAEPFELEVTSPGLERRLRRADHFQRACGAAVAVRTVASTPGARRVNGTILNADDEGVEIVLDGTDVVRRLSYSEIERAHTVVDWQAALREGKARTKREKVAMS